VQAVVKVAEGRGGEGDSVALEAVGLDVTAEVEMHFRFSFEGGYPPPGGGVVKLHGYSGLAI
jgi:hypothetical protein